MREASFEEWRSYGTAHPEMHLLQTAEWGELKSAFGWRPVRIIGESVGVQILFRKLPAGMTLAYIPKARLDESLLPAIDASCRRHRAILCKWEPDDWENGSRGLWTSPSAPHQPSPVLPGFRRSLHNIQPPRTILVDIRGSEAEILQRMKQKTRYNVRLAEKKEVVVHAWDDIEAFHAMMLVTGGRDEFGVHTLEYYRRAYDLFHSAGRAELLVAEYQGDPLAALMVFCHGRRAWYVYGASNDMQRNRMPSYLLQWEAIRWAKSRGCEEYDLWGVPDQDEDQLEANFEARSDGLWGVYRFKRGFGGKLTRAAQALDRVYNPLLYRLYMLLVGRRK